MKISAAVSPKMRELALARMRHLGGWDRYGDLWDVLLHQLTSLPKDPSEAD